MLATAYGGVARLLDGLTPDGLARPSRCAGWAVGDVLVHLLADAQRALVACATPHEGPATLDAAGYWRSWGASPDRALDARAARFTRITASAYRLPGLRAHWADVSSAAVRAVAAHDPGSFVATQGHVLTVADLERTLVLEAAVHHLDCLPSELGLPEPDPAVLRGALALCAELAGVGLAGRPGGDRAAGDGVAHWLLVAAGRVPVGDVERAVLGPAAERFPLLG